MNFKDKYRQKDRGGNSELRIAIDKESGLLSKLDDFFIIRSEFSHRRCINNDKMFTF
jgi:hypothetical protein